MKSNIFDKVIEAVSPIHGARRMRARMAIDAARGFDGAKRGPRSAGWRATGTSANAELGPALATLRNRSRDLVRNNPYIKHALDIKVANVIGTGIRAKFADSSVQQLWKQWIKECDAGGLLDFNGIQALMDRALDESGEVLLRFRNRLPGDGLSVPLQLQVLESDFLDSSKTGPIDGGHCIMGVQFNLIGQRTGYWLFDQHPGEIATIPRNIMSRFVPATEIIHLFDATRRPGQVRGLPEFATVIWKARDLDEYQDAELIRKKIEACFAAFVTTSDEHFGVGQPRNVGQESGKRIESLSPGMIEYMRPGEEVTFSAPAGTNGYKDHVSMELRALAAGTGVTYEQLSGDYSQVNFTSGRLGKMEFKRLNEQRQRLILIPILCDRVAQRFAQTAYLAGSIKSPQADVSWTPQRIEFTDPVKEGNGLISLISARLKSRRQGIRELGDDPDTVDEEIENDPIEKALPAATTTVN